jgi:hypothetical protein
MPASRNIADISTKSGFEPVFCYGVINKIVDNRSGNVMLLRRRKNEKVKPENCCYFNYPYFS